MAITQDQLDSFHQFASEQISLAEEALTWPVLFDMWRLRNPTARQQADIYAALDESLDDIRNDRHRPAVDAMADLQARHQIEQ